MNAATAAIFTQRLQEMQRMQASAIREMETAQATMRARTEETIRAMAPLSNPAQQATPPNPIIAGQLQLEASGWTPMVTVAAVLDPQFQQEVLDKARALLTDRGIIPQPASVAPTAPLVDPLAAQSGAQS